MKKTPKLSIDLHGKDDCEAQVVIDTTVRKKNITFPMDIKLYRRIATGCVQIAKADGISLWKSYTRVVRHFVYLRRGWSSIKTEKIAMKETARLQAIYGNVS